MGSYPLHMRSMRCNQLVAISAGENPVAVRKIGRVLYVFERGEAVTEKVQAPVLVKRVPPGVQVPRHQHEAGRWVLAGELAINDIVWRIAQGLVSIQKRSKYVRDPIEIVFRLFQVGPEILSVELLGPVTTGDPK